MSERLLQEVKNFLFTCGERPVIPLACMDVNARRRRMRAQNRRLPNMCVIVSHRGCFCPSRNLSIYIQLPIAVHVHLLVHLYTMKQCLQLGRIQPQVRPFAKQHSSSSPMVAGLRGRRESTHCAGANPPCRAISLAAFKHSLRIMSIRFSA